MNSKNLSIWRKVDYLHMSPAKRQINDDFFTQLLTNSVLSKNISPSFKAEYKKIGWWNQSAWLSKIVVCLLAIDGNFKCFFEIESPCLCETAEPG
jgi:hypothetical protein